MKDSVQSLPQDSSATQVAQRDRWLTEQIRQLSVDALKQRIFTCTVCGEVSGQYIINWSNKTHRFSAADTYAFLQFVLSAP